jgi:hypothetical protein
MQQTDCKWELFKLHSTLAVTQNHRETQNIGSFFVNNQLDTHFFSMYVYFYSLHVSGSHVPTIRRINCINTTSGICHSV